jgi:hypothetical protein
MECEVNCNSLWGMAHKPVRVGDISQPQILSFTYALLISLIHTLSLEGRTRAGKDELEWERRREEDGEESQDTRRQQDQP